MGNLLQLRQDTCVLYSGEITHQRKTHWRNNAPTENTIKRIVVKFEATASAAVERSTVRERQNTIRVQETIERETIERVRENLTAQPSTSTSRSSQELEIPRTTLRRILKQDLKMRPYKIQINQPLRPFDMERRFDFANEIIERIENGSMSLRPLRPFDMERRFDFANEIIERIENGSMSLERVWWSDESHLNEIIERIENGNTLDNLEMAIRQRIEGIPHATLQAVCGEFEKRLRNVIAGRGSHFENLIY
ncbi:hypothetical protein QE152_g15446 [Popillia japonica]|uniref:Uncharacterized protein n=1 Tax=Popillia japonica TaxID=7064 RepID=A0AAW1L5W7_POPJA